MKLKQKLRRTSKLSNNLRVTVLLLTAAAVSFIAWGNHEILKIHPHDLNLDTSPATTIANDYATANTLAATNNKTSKKKKNGTCVPKESDSNNNNNNARDIPFRRVFDTPQNPIHYDAILIIPYRNRTAHRDELVAHFGNYTSTYFRDKKFLILITEEDDRKRFSRSWTFNVGFITAINKYGMNQGCIILHDVDRLPKAYVPYTTCDIPTQLNSEDDQYGGSVFYPAYTGGVISMSVSHWLMVNGLGNVYRGWGKEDDDLLCRIRLNQLQGRFNVINRPPRGQGKFRSGREGSHTKTDYSQEEKNEQNLSRITW